MVENCQASNYHNQMIRQYKEYAIDYVKEQYGDHYEVTAEDPNIISPMPFCNELSFVMFTFKDQKGHDFDFHIKVEDAKISSDDYSSVNDPERRKIAEDYVKEKYGDHYRIIHQRIDQFYTRKLFLTIVYYDFQDINDENKVFTVEWDSDTGQIAADNYNKKITGN